MANGDAFVTQEQCENRENRAWEKFDKLLEDMATIKTDVKWLKEKSKISSAIFGAIAGAVASGLVSWIFNFLAKH